MPHLKNQAKNNKIFKTHLFLFLAMLGVIVFAQPTYNKAYLEEQNRKLQSEIASLNRELDRNRSESKTSILYARNLDEKIKKQNKLVSNLRKEKRFIEDEIYLTQLEINKLNRELGELRKDFKEILVKAYKNKSVQNKLLFVLSSNSFTQAYRRVKYLEKYSDYQMSKADEIKEKQEAIKQKKAEKEGAKQEKEELLVKQQVFKDELESELKEKQAVVNEFKKNERNIRNKLAQKAREQKAVASKIREIIKEEIRLAKIREEEERKKREEAERKRQAELAKAREEAARKAAAEKAREAAANTSTADATESAPEPEPVAVNVDEPEPVAPSFPDRSTDEIISGNFESNRGRLPWPVAKGTIVGYFGTNPHPVLPNITEVNDGVDIATTRGSTAKAVFDGVVTSVLSIPGGNKAVLIRHGSYFTLYHNIANVAVSKGDQVKKGTPLGTIFTDRDGQTLLNFQVWKGTSKQNPERWIRK